MNEYYLNKLFIPLTTASSELYKAFGTKINNLTPEEKIEFYKDAQENKIENDNQIPKLNTIPKLVEENNKAALLSLDEQRKKMNEIIKKNGNRLCSCPFNFSDGVKKYKKCVC